MTLLEVTPWNWNGWVEPWERCKKKRYVQDSSSGVTPWKSVCKKTLRKPKDSSGVKQKKQKKQYLAILWGGALEIVSKYCVFGFFWFSQGFFGFFMEWPQKSLKILVFFVFLVFLVFSRFFLVFSWSDPRRVWKYWFFWFFLFFWFSQGFFLFFHGVTPEESENIGFFLFFFVFLVFSRFFCFFHGVTPEESDFFFFFRFPDVFLILGRRSIVFLWGLPQSALRYCIVMTIYEEDKNGILKIRILCCK